MNPKLASLMTLVTKGAVKKPVPKRPNLPTKPIFQRPSGTGGL